MLALMKYMKLVAKYIVAYNTRSALEAYIDFPTSQIWLAIWLKYIAIQSSMLSKMADLHEGAWGYSYIHDLKHYTYSYSCITKCMQKLL